MELRSSPHRSLSSLPHQHHCLTSPHLLLHPPPPAVYAARSRLCIAGGIFLPPSTFRSAKGNPSRIPVSFSEETSTVVSEQPEDESDETKSEEDASDEEAPVVADGAGGEESVPVDFLNKIVELGPSDTYSILIYGSGALVALWIASAIVGALDSLPLIPKVMEIVGLGVTVWFTARYLVFKKNRDELFTQIGSLKEQIIGPADD